MKYAVFSAKQKDLIGSFLWRRSDGTEVEVTAVADEPGCPTTEWGDKVDLGPVEKYVRRVSEGRARFK